MFQNIFDYIDRLFAIVRPRRLLYLAIGEAATRLAAGPRHSRPSHSGGRTLAARSYDVLVSGSSPV